MRKADSRLRVSIVHDSPTRPLIAQVTTTTGKLAGGEPRGGREWGCTHYTFSYRGGKRESREKGGGKEVEEFTPEVLYSSTMKGPTLKDLASC